ncbi:hypothetical protein C1H46_032929 [Malus baccata]|uniref:RNase H type-1 domain-containing protein n=1 Tax=Malus baccata TaxID=106549 RepID=A0A540L4X3_MALBA|nr:hypothetical protein C1H46_032929 [Malus baccata]
MPNNNMVGKAIKDPAKLKIIASNPMSAWDSGWCDVSDVVVAAIQEGIESGQDFEDVRWMYHSLIQGEADENAEIVLRDMREWIDKRVGRSLWVLRDGMGQFIAQEGIGSALQVEFEAIVEGLQLAGRLQIRRVIVESDYALAIAAINNYFLDLSRFGLLVEDVRFEAELVSPCTCAKIL